MPNSSRIVITGIGPIASSGIGRENFWQGVLGNSANLQRQKCLLDGELWEEFFCHKVSGFNIADFGIDKEKLNDIKEWKDGEEVVDLNYLIAAVKLALDDSRLDYNADDNELGLVLAHENLGLMPFAHKVANVSFDLLKDKDNAHLSRREFIGRAYKNCLKSCYDVQTFADLFHIARVFNIHNYSLFINNACASGLYGLEAGANIIKNNQAKAVVVAAADCPDIYKYLWFKELGIYSADGKTRPFDRDSNGFVFGEGGVGIVMEDLGSAQNRGAQIYAEYLGAGFDLEGWKITVPEIGSSSYQRAISRAFTQAGIKKEEVELLVPHGVGSAPIDYYEAKAITDTFGKNPKKPLITAFKPCIGHNLGGSALLESAILLLALKNGVIPATLNTENIDSRFNLALVKEQKRQKITMAMKTACAFAGFNAAAVFRRFSPQVEKV